MRTGVGGQCMPFNLLILTVCALQAKRTKSSARFEIIIWVLGRAPDRDIHPSPLAPMDI